MRKKVKLPYPGMYAWRIDLPWMVNEAVGALTHANPIVLREVYKAGFDARFVSGAGRVMTLTRWVRNYGTLHDRAFVEYPENFYPDNVLAVTYDGTGSRLALIYGTFDEVVTILDDTRECGIDWMRDVLISERIDAELNGPGLRTQLYQFFNSRAEFTDTDVVYDEKELRDFFLEVYGIER